MAGAGNGRRRAEAADTVPAGTVRKEGRRKTHCGCGPGLEIRKKRRKKGKRADGPSKEEKKIKRKKERKRGKRKEIKLEKIN